VADDRRARVPPRIATSLVLALAPLSAAASGEVVRSDVHDFRLQTVADGFAHPWALAFLPDGGILVTERPGRLQRVAPASGESQRINGVPPVDARNQGGLLDVAVHPDFEDHPWVYLTWSGRGEEGNATHFGRGRLDNGALADFQTLFVATPYVDSTKHFGSRITFDGDGHVLVTVGERGERDRAQDLGDHNGSIIRLHLDGRIPDDNPFVDRPNARDAIYSYGHRNPQGADHHPRTGRYWIHEHGPRGGDEINLPEAGGNFGWPKQTYGREYYGLEIAPDTRPDVINPIHHWTPSIAPSGMSFYDGDAFPHWQGDLFVGALAQTHLARLSLNGQKVTGQERLLDDRGWRIRDVVQGPGDDHLYVLVDAPNAPLLRLRPVTD
jgi:glucose/arabinose dehydrogenase